MKKLTALLLALLMLCSICACGTPAADDVAETAEPTQEVESNVNIEILYEQDDSMKNTYTLIAVNPDANFVDADGNAVSDVELNTVGADALINWLLSEEGLKIASEFGTDEYGVNLFTLLEGGATSDAEIPEATEETMNIRLSTTTSVNDSGLLSALLPVFEEEYGYKVEVFSAGTGKAIANAQMGNADLILVHAKAKETDFVDAGFARIVEGQEAERLSFMYNYFVLCGPADDPAGVKDCESVLDAFAKIAEGKYAFVSRGDGSGTHTQELKLWPADLGITEEQESFADYTDWYVSSNAGMGVCLTMANEQGAYILSDKATFLTFQLNNGVMPEA